LAAGANINNLRNEHLDEFRIPLPPLPEQRRIAEILDKADALRAKRRAALAQLDTLTQSIFLDMFGDPATNPKGWPRLPIRELGKVITGGTPPSAKEGMFDGPIPFVTPGDLESEGPIRRTVTEAGAAESVIVRPGATLVCCIGTIGKIGIAAIRSAFNQQINAVDWNDKIDDNYGFATLRFFKPTIIAWGTSTTLPILKKSAFERIEIPAPPIDLQGRFSQRLAAINKLASPSRASLALLDELFGALQVQAFRGE
jgi:type I restriction enzyme S subunit